MNDKALEILQGNFEASIHAAKDFLSKTTELLQVSKACQLLVKCYRNGGRLYIAGNGGSAADAQHLAAEFVCKLAKVRSPLAAEALTTDTSAITAIGNDFGYEYVFSRQIEAKARACDVFLGITTSGVSANLVCAFEQCRKQDIPSIALTGHDGGKVKTLADICIIASGATTSAIQQMHIVIYHTFCEVVERELFQGV